MSWKACLFQAGLFVALVALISLLGTDAIMQSSGLITGYATGIASGELIVTGNPQLIANTITGVDMTIVPGVESRIILRGQSKAVQDQLMKAATFAEKKGQLVDYSMRE